MWGATQLRWCPLPSNSLLFCQHNLLRLSSFYYIVFISPVLALEPVLVSNHNTRKSGAAKKNLRLNPQPLLEQCPLSFLYPITYDSLKNVCVCERVFPCMYVSAHHECLVQSREQMVLNHHLGSGNHGPLWELQVLLTANLSLHPHHLLKSILIQTITFQETPAVGIQSMNLICSHNLKTERITKQQLPDPVYFEKVLQVKKELESVLRCWYYPCTSQV